MSENFEEKSWKNEWSKIDPESFQEGSQSFRTSKNIMKHNFNWPWAFRKKFKNSTKTCHSEKFWDSVLSFSSCWRMCCLAAGLEDNIKWLVEHIPVLWRVIRRQPGASLKFSIKWHLEDFWESKCWVWEIWPFVCNSETFNFFKILF